MIETILRGDAGGVYVLIYVVTMSYVVFTLRRRS